MDPHQARYLQDAMQTIATIAEFASNPQLNFGGGYSGRRSPGPVRHGRGAKRANVLFPYYRTPQGGRERVQGRGRGRGGRGRGRRTGRPQGKGLGNGKGRGKSKSKREDRKEDKRQSKNFDGQPIRQRSRSPSKLTYDPDDQIADVDAADEDQTLAESLKAAKLDQGCKEAKTRTSAEEDDDGDEEKEAKEAKTLEFEVTLRQDDSSTRSVEEATMLIRQRKTSTSWGEASMDTPLSPIQTT